MPDETFVDPGACAPREGVSEDPGGQVFDGAVVLCGPTASGKSALAVELADRLGAEILGADSQQVYRGLPIGTAQPEATLLARVPHHLIGFVEPPERTTAARYGALAREAAAEVRARGRRVLLAGGTGLYLRAALEGLFEGPAADAALRQRLEDEAAREGRAALHARLARADPGAAARIAPNDLTRVVRALEVFERTGAPMSTHHARHARARPRVAWLGLCPPRDELYRRIDARTRRIYAEGLLAEAEWLRREGLRDWAPARAVGYRDALGVLDGRLRVEDAIAATARDSRRYAKRQLTWFRAVPGVHWLPWPANPDDALRQVG